MLAITLGICCLMLVSTMWAQTTSTIEGRVTDQQGAAVAGAEVSITNPTLAITRQAATDATGSYRVAGLPAGTYAISVTKAGFSVHKLNDVEVTLNRTLTVDVPLRVATVSTEVSVTGVAPLLEPTSSSSGSTITPTQIQAMPLNGRNYLDLMQLVPGVAIQRQNDPGTNAASAYNANSGGDAVNPVLGERAGNTLFLIDGMPNSNQFSGGPASPFNQESILEFQVLTAGYKAEFGHGSGGIVNVLSKSGTNQWHGGASVFHRNYKLDSSDIPSELRKNASAADAPFLLRWDPSVQLGGPIVKDRVFFFASGERIRESRGLNFQFPTGTPQFLIDQETPFLLHNQTYETRARAKLDEQVGHHRFSQQVNWTNSQITDYLPLSAGASMPSTRSNIDSRALFLGFNDTATLGNQNNPFLLTAYGQYRGEPSRTQAAHPEGGVAVTSDNLFSAYDTGGLFGDVPPGQVSFGYGYTPTIIKQKYASFGANLAKHAGRHDLKFGWDFQRTVVDGQEASVLWNQLFATVADQVQFGPLDSGVYLLQGTGGLSAHDSAITLRNNYNGLFAQDDVKLLHNLTISGGVRWDYDSRFPNRGNVAPRIGAAWQVTPKTIVRGSWGQFYDHFRLGLVRDVHAFGGANLMQLTSAGFPRLFYGNPSTFITLFGLMGYNLPCLSSFMTDAQIAAAGTRCPNPARAYYGIDHLNSVVAAGHAPIPANAVVTIDNIQQLSGLTPADFAAQAGTAIGMPTSYFGWDTFGRLAVSDAFIPPYAYPITIAPGFKTPHTNGYQIGLQREIFSDLVVQVDYHHKDIKDILGTRTTNLAFAARLDNGRELQPGTGDFPINGYGPWYAGKYDGLLVSMRKRMSHRFSLEASYSYANETDNVIAYTGTGTGWPSDAFIGVPPVVTQAGTALGDCAHPGVDLSNANGPFVAANCNPVPQAGKFHNGPDFDKGASDLALSHTFFIDGVLQLPAKFEFSSIFRIQSGFRFSRGGFFPLDVDGNSNWNGIDFCSDPGTQSPHVNGCATTSPGTLKRNAFTAPTFSNMDIRVARQFNFSERVKLHAYFEMFNLFNTANPAALYTSPTTSAGTFGSKQQVLPGREGQVGLRIEF